MSFSIQVPKLLEIESAYRNRNRYPNMAEFTLDITSTGKKLPSKSLDPVSDMAPIIAWDQLETESMFAAGGSIIGNNALSIFPNAGVIFFGLPTGSSNFTIGYPVAQNVSKVKNYGASMLVYIGAGFVPTTITTTTYIGRNATIDFFQVDVSPPLATPPLAGDVVFHAFSFVPAMEVVWGRMTINDTYVDHILWNESKQSGIIIQDYVRHLRQIYTDSVITPSIVTTWNDFDSLMIRKTAPKTFGALSVGTNTTTRVTITPTAPSESDIYIGGFIRFTRLCATTAIRDMSRRITAYNGVTKLITFTPPLTATPSDTTDFFEILEYTTDNVNPIYNNARWLTNNSILYKIELDTLVLPNVELVNGGRITSHPYVYVKINNINNYTGSNYIMSNNPDASGKMFRVVVGRSIWNPFNKPFIKLSGMGMAQTIRFNMHNSIEFGVYLPDGRMFQPLKSDYLSPLESDKFLQISAKFIITRV